MLDRLSISRTAFVVLLCLSAFTPALSQNLLSGGASGRSFIENQGQWPEEVRYQANLNGLKAWVTSTGITYDFYTIERTEPDGQQSMHAFAGGAPEDVRFSYRRQGHVVEMELVGGQAGSMRAEEKEPTVYNYFVGGRPERWASKVASFEEVVVEGVYDGVDVRYYFDGGGLRYDFVVAPGADPAQVRMRMEGAEDLHLGRDGALVMTTSLGDVEHQRPFTYQVVDGQQAVVQSEFVLDGREMRFEVGAYDASRPLVIDPLVWATFLGGSGDEFTNGLAVDASGAAYVAGWTVSSDYPTTPGAYETEYGGGQDAFVAKLSPDGSTLEYATFLGGASDEYMNGLAVNDVGEAFVTGGTHSPDFPTTPGAYDTSGNGGRDVYVTKLSADGSTLEYSTFIGGGGSETAGAVALGGDGAAYIGGWTLSADFPATPGAFDTNFHGEVDGFVAKLSGDGSALEWATYLAGDRYDIIQGLAVGDAGEAYVTGRTYSSDFPATPGAYDTNRTGFTSVFAVQFTSDGSALEFATFLEGTGTTEGWALALDKAGAVYVAGRTDASDFPVTAGAFDTSLDESQGSRGDGFVAKFAPDGSALEWASFLGGTGTDEVYELAVDGTGAVYAAGGTWASDFPTTPGAYSRCFVGSTMAYVIEFASDGSSLEYGTLIGGDGGEAVTGLVVGDQGTVYIAGWTSSSDFPTTSNAYDVSINGQLDSFIAQLELVPAAGGCEPGEVDVEEEIAGPSTGLSVAQNYPNPFAATTTVTYVLQHASAVRLEVYDVLERRVLVVDEETKSIGAHEIRLDLRGFASGVYFYRLTAGEHEETRRMLLLR